MLAFGGVSMIRIICVGKLKEKYWSDATDEYLKRLKKYGHVEVIEIMDEGCDDKVVALRKEKERILKFVSPKDFLVTMEIEGREYSSLEFSDLITKLEMNYSNITFLIGGSYGLDEEIRNRSNLKISFSSMTFPHQLFRVMLLEQIYRAYKIKAGESYHK